MIVGELLGAAFRSLGGFSKKKVGGYSDNIVHQIKETRDKMGAVDEYWDDYATKHSTKLNGKIDNWQGKVSTLQSKVDDIEKRRADNYNLIRNQKGDDIAPLWEDGLNQELSLVNKQIVGYQNKILNAQAADLAYQMDAGFGALVDNVAVAAGGAVRTVGTTTAQFGYDVAKVGLKGAAVAGVAVGKPLLAAGVLGAKGVGAVGGVALKGTGTAAYLGGKYVAAPALKAAGQIGIAAGDQAFAAAKFAWNARDSRLFQMGVGVVGSSIAVPMAWEDGVNDARVQAKTRNIAVSADNGGLLLHGGKPAPITESMKENQYYGQHLQDYGASGDLVFALHNLRNGG